MIGAGHVVLQDAENHPLEPLDKLGLVHILESRCRPHPGLDRDPAEEEAPDAGDHEARVEVLLRTLGLRCGTRLPLGELDEPFDSLEATGSAIVGQAPERRSHQQAGMGAAGLLEPLRSMRLVLSSRS